MTGQDFQDKLDAIVLDLQTVAKGKTAKIAIRGSNNDVTNFSLSSDVAGVVNAGQLALIQAEIDAIKPMADNYILQRGPVRQAAGTFNAARQPHLSLINAATSARTALNVALLADGDYQVA